jgi:hypothetical protein
MIVASRYVDDRFRTINDKVPAELPKLGRKVASASFSLREKVARSAG